MKKIFLGLLMLCFGLYSYSQNTVAGTYPYFNSMYYTLNNDFYKFYQTANSVPRADTTTGSVGLPITDASVGTKLTTFNSGADQYTGGFFRSLKFSPQRGIVVDFEYYIDSKIKGVNGKPDTNGVPNADGNYDGGFSLNLLDVDNALVSSPTDGKSTTYNGYNLGYTYNRAKGTGSSSGSQNHIEQVGQRGGFISFGFDPSGTYKNMQHTTLNWVNGIPFSDDDKARKTGSDVTIRGPWNPKFTIPLFGNSSAQLYYGGYPVLVSQNVIPGEVNPVACPTYSLDPATGNYITSSKSFSGFTGVRPDQRSDYGDINSNNYRRAVCSLVLGFNSQGVSGYFLNATIYHGVTPVNVIKDYFVNPADSVTYKEIPAQYNYTDPTDNKVFDDLISKKLSLAIPKNLMIAFGASTSSLLSSQNSIVRNLNLYLPFSPNLKDITPDSICSLSGKQTIIDILKDTGGYNSNNYDLQNGVPIASHDYLLMSSFSFYTVVNGEFKPVTSPYKMIGQRGVYDFIYDDDRHIGYVVYTPDGSNLSPEKPDILYYNINNEANISKEGVNMGDAQFRSRIATAKINFYTLDRCPPDKYVIMNRQVSIR